MKLLPFPFVLICGLTSLSAQETTTPQWDVKIPVPIADGTPSAPISKPEPLAFNALKSRTTHMQVTEAPEMAGLPPITVNIRVTVQKVEEPDLPDPPPPLPALSPTNPAVIARLAQLRESYKGTKMVFLSATVYDHSRTLLRIYPNGKLEGEIRAWSNLDFNHFSGFSTYRVTDSTGKFHNVGLLMGIGNDINKRGRNVKSPQIPALPDLTTEGPSYVVIEGQMEGEAMNTLSQIHDLYRKEGARMESAYLAREKAHQERKAYLLANPPTPEDVTIQFWKRKKSATPQPSEEGTSAR